MRELDECRTSTNYDLAALITACIAMFLFKAGSRNEMNNLREEKRFRKNYQRLFKMPLPHMDTVDNIMRQLTEDQLQKLTQSMVRALLKKKIFHNQRLFGEWFVIAVDASGIHSFTECPHDQALHKDYSSGKSSWHNMVLEAKLITANGFAISIATEWLENPEEGNYDKQDCERKAFKRLAKKLKSAFPRLPVCLVADGLYPYQGFFEICSEYGWGWIVTFKDGNLPSVWEEVKSLCQLTSGNQRKIIIRQQDNVIEQNYIWINDIDYHGVKLHWLECIETTTDKEGQITENRFVHISSYPINWNTAPELSRTGRLRWKIENEGFNTQKNHGYALEHKFSRVSYLATKNYYQCLQIAHIINQLLVLSKTFQSVMQGKMTLKRIWGKMIAVMTERKLSVTKLAQLTGRPCQIRLIN
ncbi:hypothetical protein D5085_11120 [Ectothiorhodospiraceae bacterium BW-2]|nr:hypothetical protein D5085_10400 [Ectothiorhodospiraceae bacterium BW-2]QEP43605.1 hypothetical protein D5085_11010 [Ectothiorhodospiraceae bacterium BW-2]QEP43624.1 hypothetical protein D5085_11120 [Ectothiorhodospiraceae bacterium BW-2]